MAIYEKIIFFVAGIFIFNTCSKTPDITSSMLDGDVIFDPSLYAPAKYLVSYSNPNPTIIEQQQPVIIVSHGYTASTFEWDEYRTWAKNNGRIDFKISQVLLGGHGRTYEQFKVASWKDWQEAIITEYERLIKQGYKNISFAGSSTSGALLLNLLADRYFDNKPVKPKNIILVDPIVISSNKNLSIIKVVGPMLGYTVSNNTPREDNVYYHFRPQETLQQLDKLINIVRHQLEDGITLPANTVMKMYKSKRDEVADPVGAVLIYKGVRTANDELIEIEMVNSALHVFTRLDLRPEEVTAEDKENQQKAFMDITKHLF